MTTEDTSQDLQTSERDALKARATVMGLSYKDNIPTDKLRELVNGNVEATAPMTELELANEKLSQLKAEAMKLIRVNITCMNPMKKEWEGEIVTASNSIIPPVRKFVLFNTDEGYHIPNIIYQILKERVFQQFIKTKGDKGQDIITPKLVKEFAIDVLPQLTQQELTELARRQAIQSSKD